MKESFLAYILFHLKWKYIFRCFAILVLPKCVYRLAWSRLNIVYKCLTRIFKKNSWNIPSCPMHEYVDFPNTVNSRFLVILNHLPSNRRQQSNKFTFIYGNTYVHSIVNLKLGQVYYRKENIFLYKAFECKMTNIKTMRLT